METVLGLCGVLLALYGLVCAIRGLVLRIFTARPDGARALLVTLDRENAEAQLRAAAEERQMCGGRHAPVIVGVDCGLDEETRAVCRIIGEESGNIRLCTPQELPALVRTGFASAPAPAAGD